MSNSNVASLPSAPGASAPGDGGLGDLLKDLALSHHAVAQGAYAAGQRAMARELSQLMQDELRKPQSPHDAVIAVMMVARKAAGEWKGVSDGTH